MLAARCDGAATEDGQGYNRADASLGRSLSEKTPASWTPRQARAAHRMLAKYRGQLAKEGIDYAAMTTEALVYVCMIRLMLKRLAKRAA